MLYYRMDGETRWQTLALTADTDMKEVALDLLRTYEFRDSDNGYQMSIEFFDGVTGARSYAVGDFSGWYHDENDEWVGGNLGDYGYGAYEALVKDGLRPHVYPYGPNRDWILVGR